MARPKKLRTAYEEDPESGRLPGSDEGVGDGEREMAGGTISGASGREETGVEVEDEAVEAARELIQNVKGLSDKSAKFYLYRSDPKRKMFQGAYLAVYPLDIDLDVVYQDAQRAFGGGYFMLVARDAKRMLGRAQFEVEKVNQPGEVEEPKKNEGLNVDDALGRLVAITEKRTLLDAAGALTGGKKEGRDEGGMVAAMAQMFAASMKAQQESTALMFKILMDRGAPREVGSTDTIMEAIKLGSHLAGGKLPIEESEEGLGGIIRGLAPVIAPIIHRLMGAVPQPPATLAPAPRPGAHVPPPPPSPALPGAPEPVPVPVSAPAEDIRSIVMRRITDEIAFTLRLPATPRLYGHIIDYIDAYAPDLLLMAQNYNADEFVAYVVGLDPRFTGREEWFRGLYAYLMEEVTAEGATDPGGKGE